MLLWGVANAFIQPTLFAAANSAPRAELASGSAVLSTSNNMSEDLLDIGVEPGAMAHFLVGGGGFQNIVRDFRRPAVRHWTASPA